MLLLYQIAKSGDRRFQTVNDKQKPVNCLNVY